MDALPIPEIADELGTAREVVSRVLKQFADRGLVDIGRGETRIIDREALRGISQRD